jgi:hypothetical protein
MSIDQSTLSPLAPLEVTSSGITTTRYYAFTALQTHAPAGLKPGVSSYLRVGSRARAVLLGVFAADCVAEVGGITLQAWRHVPPHFNMQTAINTSVSMMLAVIGGILIAVLVTFAGYAFRGNPDLPASMQLALRAGLRHHADRTRLGCCDDRPVA